jgi:hypothetical protein
MPPFLASWNRLSIIIHFTMALLGVAAVRDSNPVVTHRILELKPRRHGKILSPSAKQR